MEKFIYYSGQRNWTIDDFDYLNSFLTKIFQYRDEEINKYRISTMNLYAMEDTTKAIIKAILIENGLLDFITEKYKNLEEIRYVKPLKNKLFLQKEPCHLFKAYEDLNIML